MALSAFTMSGEVYFTACLRDITERREAKKWLAASEKRFSTMADHIPQLAWMARPEGWVYWYNRR